MIKLINPSFENDGTFWMSFDDFIQQFERVNICKLEQFEETRFKCDFSVKQGEFEKYCNAYSENYYEVFINEPSTLFVGIHQQDHRTPGKSILFSHASFSIVLLQVQADSSVEVVDIDEFDRG